MNKKIALPAAASALLLILLLWACSTYPSWSFPFILCYAILASFILYIPFRSSHSFDTLDPQQKLDLLRDATREKMETWKTVVPGFIGVGVGKKRSKGEKTDTTALIFTVRAKTGNDEHKKIPKHFLYRNYYIPTDVIVVKPPRGQTLLGWDFNRSGSSYTGSAGLHVYNGSQRCILSCYHVLYPAELLSMKDNGIPAGDPGVYRASERIGHVIRGQFSLLNDAAIMADETGVPEAAVIPETNDLSGTDIENSTRISILRNGRVKSGFIQQMGHSCTITFLHSRSITMHDLILADSFTVEGDSGSVAYDDIGRLVGLVIAGDEENATYLIPIQRVLISMDVTLTPQ
jgi:hypothetical protein